MHALDRWKGKEVIKVQTLSQEIEHINIEISQAEKGHLSDLKGRETSNVHSTLQNESGLLIISETHLRKRLKFTEATVESFQEKDEQPFWGEAIMAHQHHWEDPGVINEN